MSFAVIETGGKQYKVTEGDRISVEKLVGTKNLKEGGKVTFDKVLLMDDGNKTTIGDPYIKGAKIEAEFLGEAKMKKVTVLKFKSKSRYRIKKGHRQTKATVKIKATK